MIVSHVTIEASYIRYEVSPFLSCNICLELCVFLKHLEILGLEVQLEDDKEGRRLV